MINLMAVSRSGDIQVNRVMKTLFVFSAVLWASLFVGGEAFAASDPVPGIVRNELLHKCRTYPSAPAFVTTVWISGNSDGSNPLFTALGLVSGASTVFSENNDTFYLNYATMTCRLIPGHTYGLYNAKIVQTSKPDPDWEKGAMSGNKYLSPGVAIADWGGGDGFSGGQRGFEEIQLNKTLPVKINRGEVQKHNGKMIEIKFVLDHCIYHAPFDYNRNYDHSVNDRPVAGGVIPCMSVQASISARINFAKYQTQGRSYVKNAKEAGWGAASRSITVAAGDTIQFQHELKNIGSASNDGMGHVVIRSNSEYQAIWGNKGSEIWTWTPGTVKRRNVASGQTFALATPNTNKVIQLNAHQLSYTTKPSDVGKTFCTRIEWTGGVRNMSAIHQPPAQIGVGGTYTGWACAYVAYDYSPPTPSVVGGSGSACGGTCGEVEAGTPQVPLKSSVIKNSTSTQTKPIQWKLTHFVVKPNQAIPGVGGTSPKDENNKPLSGGFVSEYGVDPCATSIYNTAAVYNTVDTSKRIQRCQTIANGTITNLDSTKTIDIPSLGMSDPLNKFSVPENAEVGTKYCFALSISPYMMSKDWNKAKQDSFKKWHHGKPGCIIVVKKPKTQFLGGGIYAGSGVVASQSTRVVTYKRRTGPQSISTSKVERKFGSWVEYELVVNKGVNSGLATNGIFGATMISEANANQAVTGIAGRTTKDVKFQNRLTLANNASTYGNFGGTNYARAFFNRMKAFYQSRLSRMVTYTKGLGVSVGSEYNSNIDVNLGAISNTEGKTTVIYAPNNTVTISGNIQNTNVNVRSVGQTIIIGKNININQDVTRVDAWLLASDSIDTCKMTVSLSSTVCNKHLSVNGPVVVASSNINGLKLNRTAGSEGAGDGIGNPGETFLLGYDAYQWIVNQANVGGVRITTSYTKELPVRY